ncbi:MAG TPA: 4Fe-4S dicluster domain-containing protein [Chloroflexota bacterium]|nr:4Fe-4S dicluster domain-containing protein [Chloroflexota bacterium]HZU05927.1 4Fe-4S dicluster domain-containing protein [Chloroflexota bacterium]
MRPADRVGTTGARPGALGFLTDTTLCIGCKACEVACKQWNQLPLDDFGFTGHSYDHTGDLGATTWRHVAFIERLGDAQGRRPTVLQPFQSHWLMMSDVCKHCVEAGCLQACPTGAIVRTEFDTVVIQQDICNGCGYCLPACPFGVPGLSPTDHKAHKCTLCYDRLVDGLEPACAKACPTDSIQFGRVEELLARARERVADLHARGVTGAYIYGDRAVGGTGGIEGLNAFFILTAPPEVYNLPRAPELPQRKTLPAFLTTLGAALALGAAAVLALRGR